ncbi:hypothetical protein KD33_16760 [Clostridium sp. NCR]|nr:hypothetical protein KD33_16760 [Clostridium sp. NCR]
MPEGPIGEAIVDKYFPSEEWEKEYVNVTSDIKSISEYTGLNFNEIYQLPYSLFLLYRKESWIYGLKQSDKGREFLEILWGLTQTKADYKKIKSFNERGGA